MARSCGLRIGPRRFELVVLDGNAKRHRIAAFHSAELSPDVESYSEEAAEEIRAALKEYSIPKDSLQLVVDSGMAAFRSLRLPFDDAEKIDQVIKFEVESQLPQWNIDEVVIDFIMQEQLDNETNLLVTAVPKLELQSVLDVCDRAHVEPLDIELEATAMANAALLADVCHLDDAQILVHIGEQSTAVVVMDAGQVRSMRAIHVGALSWQDQWRKQVAKQNQGDEGERTSAISDVDGDGDTDQAESALAEIDPEMVKKFSLQSTARLRRELGRAISGARTINPIDAVYVCGIELPDLVGSQIMDVPVYVLDVFEEDSGQPADGTAPLVVAYGAALRQLLPEVPVAAALRKEELRFTGTFEKLELPLAIASLLLVTWISVFVIFEDAQLKWRTDDVDTWLVAAVDRIEGKPTAGVRGLLENLNDSEDLKEQINFMRSEREPGEDGSVKLEFSPYDTMLDISDSLDGEVGKLKIELGETAEIPQPQSAAKALTMMTQTINDLGEGRMGRFALRKVESTYQQGSGSRGDLVVVTLNLTFWAGSYGEAVTNFENFQRELDSRGWECSEDVKTEPLEEGAGEGMWVDRFTAKIDLSQAGGEGA